MGPQYTILTQEETLPGHFYSTFALFQRSLIKFKMKHLPLLSRKATFAFSQHMLLRSALLCMTFLATTAAHAQQPFITTWKTDNAGSSSSTSITIPTAGTGYNYEVDWNNDGTYEQSGITGTVTHDFGVAGTYTIRLRGTFPRIYFNNTGDRQKLLDISQWGDIAWTTMNTAFYGCSNLNITATDLPNLNGVTDMLQMFRGCSVLNGPANIGSWNTANVTTMSSMFSGALAFNQPIGTWNTGAVLNMSFLFDATTSFNQPIGTWNTAGVTNMQAMFQHASAFNQPVENWNVGSVTNMGNVFSYAAAFDQPIGNWNTANVTNMEAMFQRTDNFNQSIANWNTSKVTKMGNMFYFAIAFNQTLGTWTLNATVDLIDMLSSNGMDCDYYTATLVGWSANPATPNGRSLRAIGRQYGSSAVAARIILGNKGWSISGDASSGTDCSAALPVTLISFSGRQQADGVLLEWQTAVELNNQGFHIERSTDGSRWTDIGFVAGKGTGTERQDYSFLDEKPQWSKNYYRLRQMDLDGKAEVSNVVIIAQQHTGPLRIFPNPVSKGALHLLLPENTEAEVVVQLFRPAGQLLRTASLRPGDNLLDVNSLEPGVYYLKVVDKPEWEVMEVVVEEQE